MSDDLVARLRHAWDERERQLAEDERVAREAEGGWIALGPDPERTNSVGRHAARHDPARVLAKVERGRRDIAAKRAILDLHAESDFPHDPEDGPGDYSWTARCNRCYEAVPCAELRLLAEAEGLA